MLLLRNVCIVSRIFLYFEGYPFVTKPMRGFLGSIVVCYRDLQLVIYIHYSWNF